MPKTKLGSEVKNYGYKKLKSNNGDIQCTLSPLLKSDLVKEKVRGRFRSAEVPEKCEEVQVVLDPFPCGVIQNFLAQPEFLTLLQSECDKLTFHEKNNDLYKFRQSGELSSESGACIGKLRKCLLSEMRAWIMEVLEVELEEERLDLFCARYQHTDTLLCHDDQLEGRKVAFILYLTEESWTEKDGGLLELFSTDERGDPKAVVTKLLPRHNSFAFFEVTPSSFHQVSEVVSETKQRISLSGWFHGRSAARQPRSCPAPAPYLASRDLEEDQFYSWINPVYLHPETQGDIQAQFEENSEISLSQFLSAELYSQVSQALAERANSWREEGPADRRCYQVLSGELDNILSSCLRFFSSQPFFLLLSNLTGLRLHELAPAESDEEGEEEEEEEKVYNPRCRGHFSKWSPGSYTLIRDDDQEQAEFALDLRMFFNVPSWSPEMGGQTSYIARGEDEELVTVEPEENTLSLVYRDKESLKFVKYVNCRLGEAGECFHDLFLTYYE